MPFPLNQMTKRFWMPPASEARAGRSAAYAVPVELNIEISGGTPTMTGTWAAVRRLRKILRERRGRLVMTCDIVDPPGGWKLSQFYQGDHQFLEAIVRFTEHFQSLIQHGSVRGSILPAGHVPEHLLDQAFLALRGVGEDFAELAGAREVGVLNSGNLPLGVQLQLDLFWFRAPSCHARQVWIEEQL